MSNVESATHGEEDINMSLAHTEYELMLKIYDETAKTANETARTATVAADLLIDYNQKILNFPTDSNSSPNDSRYKILREDRDKAELALDKAIAERDKAIAERKEAYLALEKASDRLSEAKNLLREEKAKKAKIDTRQDITSAFVAAILNETVRIDLESVMQQLQSETLTLPMKLPTNSSSTSDACPLWFDLSYETIVQPNFFRSVDMEYSFSESENNNISMLDSLIRFPIMELAGLLDFEIVFGRNQTDTSTTISGMKPDFLLWVNAVLLLKGEEKGRAAQFEVAKQELTGKIRSMDLAAFGNVDYMFAYVAAGHSLQFFVIQRSRNVSPIGSKLNLNKLKDRIKCVMTSLRICIILSHIKPVLPRGQTTLYAVQTRSNGTITRLDKCFVKILDDAPIDLNAVKAIYAAIENGSIDCTIKGKYKYTKNKHVFSLEPVGFLQKPENIDDLIDALICVACALVGLHKLQFVQRDIRWPNVVCLGNNKFILIDFENSGRDGDPLPEEFLASHKLDPLVKQNNSYHTFHDMFQFGGLIGSCDFIDVDLKKLQERVQNKNLEMRITATVALEALEELKAQRNVQGG
jgi:hypothetical protein